MGGAVDEDKGLGEEHNPERKSFRLRESGRRQAYPQHLLTTSLEQREAWQRPRTGPNLEKRDLIGYGGGKIGGTSPLDNDAHQERRKKSAAL